MSETGNVDRRGFLRGAALAGGATIASEAVAQAPANPAPPAGKSPLPSAAQKAAETEHPGEGERFTTEKTGSDFMVDVCKTLNIDYMAACPGSTFRALQESFINYGQNKKPEWLTCLHEEVSVGMGHGYAKVSGKPMAAMLHGTVGTQHAAMAIYNAWCDRVPVILFTASAGPVEDRRPGVEWMHTVQDGAATVRDFTKWDDYPWSLQSFAESTVRAYQLATAQPQAPVLITADGKLQESELSKAANAKLVIPKLNVPTPVVGDPAALRTAAMMLAAAENPVIIVDRYARSQAGVDALVKLAELLQVPVIDNRARMNFPTTHHLSQWERSGLLLSQADCILSLEPVDLFGQLNRVRDQIERVSISKTTSKVKVITISTHELMVRANYQDFQRYTPAELSITADAEATMPYLIEAVSREIGDRKGAIEARGKKLADAHKGLIERARAEAALAWDASPISSARMYAELYNVVKDMDWALLADGGFSSNWPHRMWPIEKHYQFIGGSGGSGVGYQPVAALGAALAHRDAGGRLPISITGDGEFNMAPHTLWTAVHHKIPYLTIIQNNRAYHQEVMHLQHMANRHNRNVENAHIGTTIDNPNIDYAKVAEGYGAVGIGPISNPAELGAAIKKGVDAVKDGQTVLIDVVMQPR
jgi:thiamine pyrophosphate-dependent acetolactate synthase large subunit-like protein